MKLSVVIPIYNEAENIAPLFHEVYESLEKIGSFEVIIVNDGSTDTTQEVLLSLRKKYPKHLSVIQLLGNVGKAAAYTAGFHQARGEYIVTLDGDGQDDPAEISKFLQKINEGYDLVVGWKQNRRDSWIKNKSSKLFNAVTAMFSPVALHDYNCGLKAYKAECAKRLVLYGEMHRFIPVILSQMGYRVTEIPIHHRKRMSGNSKYGAIRFVNGFLDLLTVVSLSKFRSRPMHLFGYLGLICFGLGFLVALYLTYSKLVLGNPIGERPLLLFSVMLMIMGVQVGITGLVGEYIVVAQRAKPGDTDVRSIVPHD